MTLINMFKNMIFKCLDYMRLSNRYIVVRLQKEISYHESNKINSEYHIFFVVVSK